MISTMAAKIVGKLDWSQGTLWRHTQPKHSGPFLWCVQLMFSSTVITILYQQGIPHWVFICIDVKKRIFVPLRDRLVLWRGFSYKTTIPLRDRSVPRHLFSIGTVPNTAQHHTIAGPISPTTRVFVPPKHYHSGQPCRCLFYRYNTANNGPFVTKYHT